MELTLSEITEILKTRPHGTLVNAVQVYSKKLTMHVTGVGLDSYIEKIDNYENTRHLGIRLKYSKSNKDFMSRLFRPKDKIFTASGGSAYYDIPNSAKADFIYKLNDVECGHSLRNWMQTFWAQCVEYDPMGLVFIEVDEDGEAYPTYKSTSSIYDYKLEGREVEYVVFKTDIKRDNLPVYRVVDDVRDYMVKWDGKDAVILEDLTYENYFGKVPAFVLSDRYDPVKGYYISPSDEIIELADNYLLYGGILNVYQIKAGYPKQWIYMGACKQCKGTGRIKGDECHSCNGTGKQSNYDVSDVIALPVPTQGDPIISPPAGQIDAAVNTWQEMKLSQEQLFNLAYFTKWGVEYQAKAIKTATEIVYDEQPKIEALYAYSNAAEWVEKQITDYIGWFYYGNNYKGASVAYGKRFMIESPDAVLKSLTDLITKNAPYEVVREKLEEYYHVLYQSDSMRLNTQLKLIDVEPMPFYSLQQSKGMLSDLEYIKKTYYNDWRGLQSTKNILPTAPIEKLRSNLEEYALKRYTEDKGKIILETSEEVVN